MFDFQIADPGTVKLVGRLDASEADKALAMFRTIDQPVTIDMAGLDYISSAGIGVLIETFKRLQVAGHAFKLVRLQPRVRNVFAYAGLDRLLNIE
jgi:anti-sigma B factor antagonist